MKVINILKFVFGLIGAALLSGAAFWYLHTTNIMENSEKTEGVVVFAGRIPTISFLDHNENTVKFSPNISCQPPCYDLNEKVTVYFNKDNPKDATISGIIMWLGPIILGGIGTVFFSIGMGFFIFAAMKKKKKEYLLRHGIQIEAKFKEIIKNRSVRMNRQHPYMIVVEWFDEDSNKLYLFQSDNIWFNPGQYIKDSTITVFIERDNPKKYYVDISFLPELA
jgi:hypothetical protein